MVRLVCFATLHIKKKFLPVQRKFYFFQLIFPLVLITIVSVGILHKHSVAIVQKVMYAVILNKR